jgi:hypothetical protein
MFSDLLSCVIRSLTNYVIYMMFLTMFYADYVPYSQYIVVGE